MTDPVRRAFTDEPDLSERRFVLDEAVFLREHPQGGPGLLDDVRRHVAAGHRVIVDPHAGWLARPATRTTLTIMLVIGIVLIAVGAQGWWDPVSPLLTAGGVLVCLAVIAGVVVPLLPGRPRLAGVEVTSTRLGWTWADKRLRTAIRSIQTILASRALHRDWLDRPAVRLSLTDQLADLRVRTSMINNLEAEIGSLPRKAVFGSCTSSRTFAMPRSGSRIAAGSYRLATSDASSSWKPSPVRPWM